MRGNGVVKVIEQGGGRVEGKGDTYITITGRSYKRPVWVGEQTLGWFLGWFQTNNPVSSTLSKPGNRVASVEAAGW